jgi:hypothetical protein
MPLPLVTIGLSLAAVGLKMFGGEDKLLELIAHPLDIAAGDLIAGNILELSERLRERFHAYERIRNEDLERAVAQCAALADLFCLLDALPGLVNPLQERFVKWLPKGSSLNGIVTQMEESVIRHAIAACEESLEAINQGDFDRERTLDPIDPLRLALAEHGGDWGAILATQALKELNVKYKGLPERLDVIFEERWFKYLCLTFHEQLKAKPRVSAIFLSMQIATGFVKIEEAIREFRDESRQQHAEIMEAIRSLTPARPRIVPVKPCNLPYASLGKLFVGRDNFLNELRHRILSRMDGDRQARPVAISQTARQAISGLGGIGKTRLAVEYALRYSEDYSALLFVVADSPEHLRKGFGELALILDIKEVASQQDEEVRFAAALRWLMEHPGWCLIFDNVDDESAASACEQLASKLYGGHIIITTRLTQWSKSGIETLDLDVLDRQSAKALLLARTTRRFMTRKDDEAAAELAELLDGLALGLEQAGAFIDMEQCSISQYVDLWKNGDPEVTDWYDPRIMKYPKSVAMTWNTTVQRMGSQAEALLRLLSCFALTPVPAEIFSGPDTNQLTAGHLSRYAGASGE